MKNILEQVVDKRREAVAKLKSRVSIQSLEQMPLYKRKSFSFKAHLLNGALTGIIAEFKRASPSKGIINDKAAVLDVATAYEKHGAAAISILTEPDYFKGNDEDIISVREAVNIPILRKDFIVDEYQIAEAKSIGADVILLIAASLTPTEVKRLARFANNIGLEVLLELHDEEELQHICDETAIIGINNRNLKTFEVDIARSLRMAEKIPADKIKIAESGIDSIETICTFKNAGFKGFLIGENFMKQPEPTIAFAEFVQQLNAKVS